MISLKIQRTILNLKIMTKISLNSAYSKFSLKYKIFSRLVSKKEMLLDVKFFSPTAVSRRINYLIRWKKLLWSSLRIFIILNRGIIFEKPRKVWNPPLAAKLDFIEMENHLGKPLPILMMGFTIQPSRFIEVPR